jgi:hypothetical protein
MEGVKKVNIDDRNEGKIEEYEKKLIIINETMDLIE